MNLLRSYENDIVSRIKKLGPRFNVTIIGEISFGQFVYPMYRITTRNDGGQTHKKDILISGIVHGDEPAGGFAILDFLERHAEKYLNRFNFYCYPCVNMSGFETAMRVNMDYVNINRHFKEPPDTQEFSHILRSLRAGPRRYHLTIDMHESPPFAIDPKEKYLPKDNPREFWMWETALKDSGLRIGDKVIAELSAKGVPICKWPTIYDDINSGGVIWYPDGNVNEFYAAGISFEGYLYSNYTNHSFTTETPTSWPLIKRVETQVQALVSILDFSLVAQATQ